MTVGQLPLTFFVYTRRLAQYQTGWTFCPAGLKAHVGHLLTFSKGQLAHLPNFS